MNAPKIKFCGITREQDAELAVSLDAWAVGMIMWPHSPRAVPLDRAAEPRRVAEAPGRDRRRVRQPDSGRTRADRRRCRPDDAAAARRGGTVVLHRGGAPHGLQGDQGHARPADADIQSLGRFHTDFHLLDSYRPGVPGGTGEVFTWELASAHRRLTPPKGKGQRVPLILSGGLTPENVADAIAAVRPFAVDVASGIESAPGYKDAAKMRAFAEAVAATGATADPDIASGGAGSTPLPTAHQALSLKQK